MHTSWFDAAGFRPLERTTLAQQLADHLRRQVLSGELRPGHRLPPIRRLAELAGVSVPTASQAIQALTALGLVHTRHGVGTFVTRRRDERRLLVAAVRRATTVELADLCSLLDRQGAARAAARFASRRRPSPSVASRILFLARERSSARNHWPEVFTDADLALHEAIMNAAGKNGMLAARLRSRLGLRLRPVLMNRAIDLPDDDELDSLHRELAATIVGGDQPLARTLAARVAESEMAALG